DRAVQFEFREIMGAWNRVVHQRAGQELAVFVVHDFFMQGLTDALHETAVNLSLDKEWIDHVAAIVDSHIFRDLRFSRFFIEFDHTNVSAEWEGEVRWLKEPRRIQPRFDPGRKVHCVIRRSHHVSEIEGSPRVAFCRELPDAEFNLVRSGLQQVCRNLFHLLFYVLDSKVYRRSSNRGATASEGTYTRGDARGVTVH